MSLDHKKPSKRRQSSRAAPAKLLAVGARVYARGTIVSNLPNLMGCGITGPDVSSLLTDPKTGYRVIYKQLVLLKTGSANARNAIIKMVRQTSATLTQVEHLDDDLPGVPQTCWFLVEGSAQTLHDWRLFNLTLNINYDTRISDGGFGSKLGDEKAGRQGRLNWHHLSETNEPDWRATGKPSL